MKLLICTLGVLAVATTICADGNGLLDALSGYTLCDRNTIKNEIQPIIDGMGGCDKVKFDDSQIDATKFSKGCTKQDLWDVFGTLCPLPQGSCDRNTVKALIQPIVDGEGGCDQVLFDDSKVNAADLSEGCTNQDLWATFSSICPTACDTPTLKALIQPVVDGEGGCSKVDFDSSKVTPTALSPTCSKRDLWSVFLTICPRSAGNCDQKTLNDQIEPIVTQGGGCDKVKFDDSKVDASEISKNCTKQDLWDVFNGICPGTCHRSNVVGMIQIFANDKGCDQIHFDDSNIDPSDVSPYCTKADLESAYKTVCGASAVSVSLTLIFFATLLTKFFNRE